MIIFKILLDFHTVFIKIIVEKKSSYNEVQPGGKPENKLYVIKQFK